MSIFKGESWGIELLPEWIGEHEEDCSTIYHPNGVGALQISAYSKDSEVTEEDLKDLASEHIEAGTKLAPAISGDFRGFTLAFGIESEFWQHWYVSSGNKVLFVTYNCEDQDKVHEISQIKEMVATLSAQPTG
ncbi:MAG: hypothetical protein LJE85_00380 [Gammaproteobacteria bacterium]|jgi:hypothetical protein|nr:hypothetical protein [Gammaproteobacteria bacterium]